MYDYSHEPRYEIEEVDHEIHILGVKLGYFPYLLWGFLIGLFIGGPIVGIGLVVASVVLCRLFFLAEERGEPVSFDPRLARVLEMIPFGLGYRLFPNLTSIERAILEYRE